MEILRHIKRAGLRNNIIKITTVKPQCSAEEENVTVKTAVSSHSSNNNELDLRTYSGE